MPKNLNLNVNISELETVKCFNCDRMLFTKAIEIRKIPGILSNSGKPEVLQLEVFVCLHCNRKLEKEDIFGEESANVIR